MPEGVPGVSCDVAAAAEVCPASCCANRNRATSSLLSFSS